MADVWRSVTSAGVKVKAEGRQITFGSDAPIPTPYRPVFIEAEGDWCVWVPGEDGVGQTFLTRRVVPPGEPHTIPIASWRAVGGHPVITDGEKVHLIDSNNDYWRVWDGTLSERKAILPPARDRHYGWAAMDRFHIPADPLEWKGKTLSYWTQHGEWTIGANGGRLLAERNGQWYVANPTDRPVMPHARLMADGSLMVALQRNGGTWRHSSDFTKLADEEEPIPVPTPLSGCYPRRMLFSPYYSYSERYGKTDEHLGNVTFIEDNVDAPGPYIQDIRRYRHELGNLTLASWIGVADLDEEPDKYEEALDLGKPVILYLDSRNWPSTKPSWLDPSRTWLGVQAYRGAGESVEEFKGEMVRLLDRLSRWGIPLVLSIQAYDRNGAVSAAHAVQALNVVDSLIEDYRIIGLQPFADLRPGGMSTHPEIRAKVREMFSKVPGRPNRFDYWAKDKASLVEKLKYDVPQLTKSERKLLTDLLTEEPSEPPFPEPVEPPSLDEITWLHADVSQWKVTSEIERVEIDEDTICIYHTMAGRWPSHPSHPIGEGNPWVIARVDGQWFGATYEWLKTGQTCKHIEREGEWGIGPHTKKEPLESWIPRKGELVGFFVSTFARDSARTLDERSNIHWMEWPY